MAWKLALPHRALQSPRDTRARIEFPIKVYSSDNGMHERRKNYEKLCEFGVLQITFEL